MFNAVPPAPRLAVGLPLTYIVLTGIFLAWLIGLTVLSAATNGLSADRRPQRHSRELIIGERRSGHRHSDSGDRAVSPFWLARKLRR
jgi:hypothetical protein